MLASACTLLRSLGSPAPVTESALKVKCEHTATAESKPSNYLKETEEG